MSDSQVNLFGPSDKNDIRVGYISTTRGYVTGVGVNDANIYAKSDPGTKFILQNRDYIKYLNINEVNKLGPEVLESTAAECKGVEWDAPVEDPEVLFAGGGGVGVVGNPVFGADGALLAVDLVSGGFGYKYAPVTTLKDTSGAGAGAHLISIVGEVADTEIVYDKKEDYEEYIIEEETDVVESTWYGPDGKSIGKWDPSLYGGDEDLPFSVITDNYIQRLHKIATSGVGGAGLALDNAGTSGKYSNFTTAGDTRVEFEDGLSAGVFWWTAKGAPKFVAGNGKTTRKIYKVEHVAWNEIPPKKDSEGKVIDWSTNGWLNTHAISPVPPSHAKGTDHAGELFSLEWDVDFPWDGEYSFKGCADNSAIVYFDNEELTRYKLGSGGAAGKILSLPTIVKKEVTEGSHKIRVDLKNTPITEKKKVQASSKTYGSLLQLEDIPNVDAGSQGGVVYDDLQCYAKIGRFFDINSNKAKYKVDPSFNQPDGSEIEVEYKVTSNSAFVNKIEVRDLFTEQGPEVIEEGPTEPEISQREASAKFISRGSGQSTEYYMIVTGNDLLEINFEFRSHLDDSTRGTGLSVEQITIQTENEPLTLVRGALDPNSPEWPFENSMISNTTNLGVDKKTFKHGKEYRVTFRETRWQQNNAPAPELFNNDQGIAFYDNDTSGGPTRGPDLDGDVRAHFKILSKEQLSDKVPSIPGELKLKQIQKTFKKTVVVGKVYPVTVSNAGQGLMGNYPAPVGALKAKDIINQDTQIQDNTGTSVEKTKVFNTTDYITSANRKLWRTNVNNKGGFMNEYGICPFDTLNTLPDNPYSGTHTIRWNHINFPISGNYTISIGVDDEVDLEIGTKTNESAVRITKEGYIFPKGGGIKSTGVSTYVRYIEAGTYTIKADLTQIPGGKFGFGKIRHEGAIHDYSGRGLNPMALAINIETTVAVFEDEVAKSWHANPMGVALNIKAPLPPAPVQPIPIQEGRCPSNPIWSTRFPGAKNGTWYPVRFGSWGEFHNKYGMSPVPPLPTGGTDHGGVPFINSWNVDIPYAGWYKLKAIIDDIGKISIDGEVKLELSNKKKVEYDESLFYLSEGLKEIEVEIKNNSTRKVKMVDQKIFNTKDWVNITPKTGGGIQKVDFKVTSNSAFVNSINIKGLLFEQAPNWESTTRSEDTTVPGPTIPAAVEFIQRGSKYYLKASGNKRVKVKFDFRVHENDKNRGGGPSVRFVNINAGTSSVRFDIGPTKPLPDWPFVGSSEVKDIIFENGKEYEVTFGGLLSGATPPRIGGMATPAICFFDTDTSDGATPGPDFDGDVRAYITALNVIQMDDPDPVEGEPIDVLDKKLVQSINPDPIVRDVVIGQVYEVEVANAGQGLMGNYPAPVGALKASGGVLMLEDIPNVSIEDQKVLFDDLVCSASAGRFYDIQGNKCKYVIDLPTSGGALRNGVTYNGPKLWNYKHNSYGSWLNSDGVSPDYPVIDNGQTINYVWSNVDFPENGEYTFKFANDAHGSLYLDGQTVIDGDFDTVAGISDQDRRNWDPGLSKRIKVNKGKHVIAVAPKGRLGLTDVNADGLFRKLSDDYYRGQQAWENNASAMAVSITRRVDTFEGTSDASKSWYENPISISAELIPPPCPRKVKGGGVIEEVIVKDPGNGYPTTKGPGYPAILKLKKIDVDDPGINYDCAKDNIVIEPSNGAEAKVICDNFGRIGEVEITNPGIGFTGYPEVYMDSPTGVAAAFTPQFEVIRDPLPVPDPDKLIQVTDLVGLKQTGYYDGRPYYGAVFYKNGVRYAGYYETAGQLVQIYDTLQESIDAMVTTPPSAIQRQGTDINSDDPNLDIPNTPDTLI